MNSIKTKPASKKELDKKKVAKYTGAFVGLVGLAFLAHKGAMTYIGTGQQGRVVIATGAVGFLVYAILGIYL